MDDAERAFEWWMSLAGTNKRADVEEWLEDNPPPEGTSGIQWAWDHREEEDELPGGDDDG